MCSKFINLLIFCDIVSSTDDRCRGCHLSSKVSLITVSVIVVIVCCIISWPFLVLRQWCVW